MSGKTQYFLSHSHNILIFADQEPSSNYGIRTSNEARYQFTSNDKLAFFKDNCIYTLSVETRDANLQVIVIGLEFPMISAGDIKRLHNLILGTSFRFHSPQMRIDQLPNTSMMPLLEQDTSEIDYGVRYVFPTYINEIVPSAKSGRTFDLLRHSSTHLLQPQVIPWHTEVDSISSPSEYQQVGGGDSWTDILNEDLTLELRVQKLIEAHEADPARARALVIEQLLCATDNRWIDELVLFTENLQIIDMEDRAAITSKLLEIAERHAFGSTDLDQQVLYSALRTAGSMITIDKVSQLEVFLKPPKNVDTHTVTYLVLVNIYEIEVGAIAPNSLMLRVSELVDNYLSSNMITPGENSARLCMAIQALAAIGSDDVAEVIERVIDLNQEWLRKEIVSLLCELESNWMERMNDSKIGSEKLSRLQNAVRKYN